MGAKSVQKTALQRVQARIKERLDADDRPRGQRRTRKGLAKLLGIRGPSMTELLDAKSSRGLLTYLDDIAEYLGVPPSLLVAKGQSSIAELRKLEPKMLAHFRKLPDTVQAEVVAVFDHFNGLLPEEREARLWWSKIRRIKRAEDRARLEQMLDDVLLSQRTVRPSTDDSAVPNPDESREPASQPTTGVHVPGDR